MKSGGGKILARRKETVSGRFVSERTIKSEFLQWNSAMPADMSFNATSHKHLSTPQTIHLVCCMQWFISIYSFSAAKSNENQF